LHIHPAFNNTSEFGVDDANISHISSIARKSYAKHAPQPVPRRYDAAQWHSDIQFEPVPADYTSLRLTKLPKTGGDTLWASGYEIYDRFSEPYQKFFESLTATFIGDGFIKVAESNPELVTLYEQERGSPHNIGRKLSAVHPVVRTNPVTGWKSIFALGSFTKYINELTREESADLLKKFVSVIYENHDVTVRFKWRNQNDIGKSRSSNAERKRLEANIVAAIWDNRSFFHSATFDYDSLGERTGNRAVGIGEIPYLDPHSRSRSEFLKQAQTD